MDKKKILIITVLLFGLTASYRLMNPYEPVRVKSLTYTQGARAKVAVSKKKKPAQTGMMIDYFLTPPVYRAGFIKNPFMISAPPEIREKPPEPEIILNKDLPEAKEPSVRIGEELGRLKIMGYYRSHGEMAVFIRAGSEVLVLKQGNLLHERYRVTDISESKITLKALEINEKIIIDISRF